MSVFLICNYWIYHYKIGILLEQNLLLLMLMHCWINFYVPCHGIRILIAQVLLSLPRVQSDHNSIILHSQAMSFVSLKNFRFERDWLSQEGFMDLVIN